MRSALFDKLLQNNGVPLQCFHNAQLIIEKLHDPSLNLHTCFPFPFPTFSTLVITGLAKDLERLFILWTKVNL